MDIIMLCILFSQYTVSALSLFFSLRLINKDVPDYMRGFYLYPLIAFLIYVTYFIQPYFHLNIHLPFILNNFSLIFHFSFLSFFIFRSISQKKAILVFKILFFLFLAAIIVYFIINDITEIIPQAISISSIGLIIFCVKYYYNLFNNFPTIKLQHDPAFWIISGIFFTMSLSIPLNLFLNFLSINVSYNRYRIFGALLVFSYTILHGFFIKGILCALKISREKKNEILKTRVEFNLQSLHISDTQKA